MQSDFPIQDAKAPFSLKTDKEFEFLALKTFQHQANLCTCYQKFLELRNVTVESVENITQIPPLPIEFFKTERVISGEFNAALTFTSSGTTGSIPSRHYIKDRAIYETSFLTGFRSVFGSPADFVILGLLPSYLERSGSSLVYMVEHLIRLSGKHESGFFLDDFERLAKVIRQLVSGNKKFILFGVSFALIDFAMAFDIDFRGNIVIETGGMKGRKEEMTREELHDILNKSFHLDAIHSEYGMTELLSQAWSKKEGRFSCPPWMRVMIRDVNDPSALLETGRTGAVNIIDLANMHSCSFIATDDLGRMHEDGTFEILGRMDNSDLRGCSLLAV